MEGGGACLFGILREVSHATSMPSNILHNLVLNVRLYTRDNLHEKKKTSSACSFLYYEKETQNKQHTVCFQSIWFVCGFALSKPNGTNCRKYEMQITDQVKT